MKRIMELFCVSFCLCIVGCGGVDEVPAPDKAPEMSAEETQNMENEMAKMREMRNQKKKK